MSVPSPPLARETRCTSMCLAWRKGGNFGAPFSIWRGLWHLSTARLLSGALPGLSEELYDNQVKNITNIDISEVCVNHMKAKHEDKQEMQCESAAPPLLRTLLALNLAVSLYL